jgi:O-antigen ligase
MEGLLLFALACGGLLGVIRRPEWGAPYFAFLVYMRLSDVLRGEFELPSLFMLVAPGLVLLAVGRWLVAGTPVGRGWKPALWLMLAYGAVCVGSLLYAMRPERSVEALMNQLDGFFIVMVMALYLRTFRDFERTLHAILLAGLVLASLSVIQQLSGMYDATFAGFAKAGLRNIADEASGYRSEGPVSANYFALILVVVIPLAVERILHAESSRMRMTARITLIVALVSIGFTYSRGGVVALAAICVPMLVWVPRRRIGRLVVVSGLTGLLGLALLAPTHYGQRLAALTQVLGAAQGDVPEDSALRGRLSEVTSAAMMFADHPIVGVGYGNFEVYYHRYARTLALDGRREERQAHSLYLEVAAETGIVGVLVFGGLLAYLIAGALQARALLAQQGRVRESHLVTGFAIALLAYLAGSVFLHLSYPRYFWLLVGTAIGLRGIVIPAAEAQRVLHGAPAPVGGGA